MKLASFLILLLSTCGLMAYFVDPFVFFIIAGAGSLWIGLPCLLTASIGLLLAISRKRSLHAPLIILVSVIGIFSSLLLTIPINDFLWNQAEIAAKAYPEKIAPLLETYRANHGFYPKNLNDLGSKPPIPRLLRTSYSYRSDGTSYSFTFAKPGGLIDTWDYESTSHQWSLST